MAVTIVLCTYNDSQFLPKAIESCLQQGMETQIVLVDDCSSNPIVPEVQELVRKHGIKYVRHGTNLGLSAARNTGIAVAQHQWVVPLDADDWFYPNAVKALYEAREGFDIVGGNCTDVGVYAPAISREPLSAGLFKRENPLVCSSLFSKAIWARVNGYMVRKGPHYEDWNFWARCFKAGGRFKYLPLTVYHHTSRPDSMLRVLHPQSAFYRQLATEGVF